MYGADGMSVSFMARGGQPPPSPPSPRLPWSGKFWITLLHGAHPTFVQGSLEVGLKIGLPDFLLKYSAYFVHE